MEEVDPAILRRIEFEEIYAWMRILNARKIANLFIDIRSCTDDNERGALTKMSNSLDRGFRDHLLALIHAFGGATSRAICLQNSPDGHFDTGCPKTIGGDF